MLDRYGTGGLTDAHDRTQLKAKLAVLLSNLKVKPRPGMLDKLADDAVASQQLGDVIMRVDMNDSANLKYLKAKLRQAGYIEAVMTPDDLIQRVLEGESAEAVVGELIIGVQTPPPPMTDKERKKKRMGAGIEPESNKATYYPNEPGSQGWFEV